MDLPSRPIFLFLRGRISGVQFCQTRHSMWSVDVRVAGIPTAAARRVRWRHYGCLWCRVCTL